MGHHYVPQEYLRAFETPTTSGEVWAYDKTTDSAKPLPIKAVAQARDFYDVDVERQLSAIEGPAHAVLQRLHSERRLLQEDRPTLAYYIAVMMYRGPRRRRKGEELIPVALEKTIREVESALDKWAAERGEEDPAVAQR